MKREPRTAGISVRLTESEYLIVEAKATASGFSLSEYARVVLLKSNLKVQI